MIHISLFSGIGRFDLAAEWMGWRNMVSCDINEFGNKVRAHYWPDAYHHTDIHTLTYETINKELTSRFGAEWRSDDIILTGGFPCQPYSSAGKRLGKEDSRHLWPEMLRVIREVAPSFIVGENVRGLTNWNGGLVFNEVCADLEALGYQVAPFIIPASAVNAPHQRERIWFVAYTKNIGRAYALENGELERGRFRFGSKPPTWDSFPSESPVCGGNDGLPTELDGITFSKWRNESIKAYGNAVVPQVVYQIFQAIQKSIETQQ